MKECGSERINQRASEHVSEWDSEVAAGNTRTRASYLP